MAASKLIGMLFISIGLVGADGQGIPSRRGPKEKGTAVESRRLDATEPVGSPRGGSPVVPSQISHQGRVSVNGQPFSGQGTFYFALVGNGGSGNNLWTNDESNLGTALMPNTSVQLTVSNGVYSANLGGGTMTPISPSVFNNADVVLRIWFEDDQSSGVELLSPDQPLGATAYSFRAENGCPPGTIIAFAGSSIPSGWMTCNGSVISRTEFAGLYAAIGTSWGTGDGSTTFNLPDLRGLFLRGVSQGSGHDPDAGDRLSSPYTSGGNGGDTVGSYQGDQAGPHGHSASQGAHNHGGINIYFGESGTGGAHRGANTSSFIHTLGNVNVQPEIMVGSLMTSEARPKNAYVNWIIKY